MTVETAIREKLRAQPLLVMTHIICGYPSLEDNWRMLRIMSDAAVALVEFQFPFSEPSADGPIFCKANQRSLERGTRVGDCFSLMRRAADELSFMPLMMGYCNTAFKMGYEIFCERLAQAGGRGFILPDLPPEESHELGRLAKIRGLAPIHLMTPTTRDDRMRLIAEHGVGFHYCVARRGVTGSHTRFGSDLDAFLARCRKVTSLPLAVGFGLSSPEDVVLLKGKAEIAIIGTAVLKTWELQGEAATEKLIHSLAQAAT